MRPARPTWWDDARCLGAGTEIFFDPDHWLEADKMCAVCPAKEQCRDAAIDQTRRFIEDGETELDTGFFGRTTPKLRQRLVREQLSQYSQTEPVETT